MSIGKVAAHTGCNRETIRFYEKEALLPKPERTEGGHRIYTKDIVNRLVFIRRARELGFAMAEVRQLLSIIDGDQISCEQVKKITDTHLQDVRLKIKDLKNMERTLSFLSSKCSGIDIPECPIIDMLQDERPVGDLSE